MDVWTVIIIIIVIIATTTSTTKPLGVVFRILLKLFPLFRSQNPIETFMTKTSQSPWSDLNIIVAV